MLPILLQVAAGKAHSLALTAFGDVYAWGKNWYGELGTGRVDLHKFDDLRGFVVGCPLSRCWSATYGMARLWTAAEAWRAAPQLITFGRKHADYDP